MERHVIASGVSYLDHLLGGLFIGDNVVWHDDAGSLASIFCLNLLKASKAEGKPLIYVSFDRSPKNLLDKLGPLAEGSHLTILDCFTYGKGEGSEIFARFYGEMEHPCTIQRVEEPHKVGRVMDTLYAIHRELNDSVRFIFESLTGMQELWGREEDLARFYSHSCPRLYELNTVAYWIMEKRAHSPRLRAKINQIAQVAVDLSVKRGRASLTILKAENRNADNLNHPFYYWSEGLDVTFDNEKKKAGRVELGARLKELRVRKGLSQTELAKLVGVTSSTISQIESNLIYPSLTALIKMAEVLSVEVSSFFREPVKTKGAVVFSGGDSVEVGGPVFSAEGIRATRLTPIDFDTRAEPYLVEIPARAALSSHFFTHKGEEIGYLLSGHLELKIEDKTYRANPGDIICLTTQIPSAWVNPEPGRARLLWFKVK
ncbi:MAG: helix-turn-helix domain-containing protein [Deltaproteobacteria bacterium]|nr:helix-turn-helix domain-containing protein [Deltaproteobacteria bacterium]MBW2300326.1 helix-turn-helix domain-containing protein [Deltaproteobacteria bacterium]